VETLRGREFRRILLIKPSALGDVIHTLPVLAKLRARYPAAQIGWLLTPAIAELVRHHPALSKVLLFPRQGFSSTCQAMSTLAEVVRLLAAIRRERYDLVLDLHGQMRSAVFTLASGAPVRIGFDRPRRQPWQGGCQERHSSQTPPRRLVPEAYRHGWTGAREGSWLAYSHRIPVATLDVHAVDRYLWVGRLLGFADGPAEFHIPIPLESVDRIAQVLDRLGILGTPLAVLVPGTTWQTKHWMAEGFAEVGRYLCRTGRAVVLAGTAGERGLCRTIAAHCPAAHDLSGQTTLSELAALLRRAAVCVTNDSGSMHLAVALQRPVVSIFGPTDPLWIGPYHRPNAVLQTTASCAPCYLRRLRQCPHDHICMKGIPSAQVIVRVEAALAGSQAAAG
jgi:ADP-heptose:LPS heptosyltransferase